MAKAKRPPGDTDTDGSEGHTTAACPICSAPSVATFRPFCSGRCADVDLSRWLRGAYAIPVTEDDDEDGLDAGAGEGVAARFVAPDEELL